MDKLGQLLVARGWITAAQLTRALRNQNVVGGHLGTCLLEMDAVSEDLLLKALSEQVGVPAATIDELRRVPEEVTALVPPKLAIRCRAVPFRAGVARIDVAMLDPRDLTSQDELAFASGKRVKAHVAHEVRIHEALDRYYGEECPSRFALLLDRLNRARFFWEREGEAAAAGQAGQAPEVLSMPSLDGAAPAPPHRRAAPAAARAVAPPRPAVAAGTAAPLIDLPLSSARRAPTPPPPPPARAAAAPAEPGARPAAPAPPRAIALTPEERSALRGDLTEPAPAPAPPAGAPATPAAAVPTTIAEVEAAFAGTHDRDEVARVLVNFLARSYRRVALFQVGRDRVTGWIARGQAIDRERIAGFSVGLDQPSVFLNLAQGSGLHLGPLPPMPAHRELALAWGGELPAECVVVPVRIKDRLVTVIYADGGGGRLKADLEGLRRLAAATAAVFERSILHKKRGADGAA